MMEIYTKAEIEILVWKAIRMLIKNDAFLLGNDANERSISHKYAEYLQQLFPDYHVDCEYNRHGFEKKKFFNHLCEECESKDNSCKDNKTDRIVPDVIVHSRGNDTNNILIVEMKKSGSNDDCDKRKLELFTSLKEEYKYSFGVLIRLLSADEVDCSWFAKGEQIV